MNGTRGKEAHGSKMAMHAGTFCEVRAEIGGFDEEQV
jgi:hypothetical protein